MYYDNMMANKAERAGHFVDASLMSWPPPHHDEAQLRGYLRAVLRSHWTGAPISSFSHPWLLPVADAGTAGVAAVGGRDERRAGEEPLLQENQVEPQLGREDGDSKTQAQGTSREAQAPPLLGKGIVIDAPSSLKGELVRNALPLTLNP